MGPKRAPGRKVTPLSNGTPTTATSARPTSSSIGSRAKVARIYDALTAESTPATHLERVHAPIGLDIGAVTPQEIAVSILAELIAVKHGKNTTPGGGASMKWMPRSTINSQLTTDKSKT